MKTFKLGKMERDYSSDMPCSTSDEKDKEQPMVERFPTVYMDSDEGDLPELKVGQKVTFTGVVTEFGKKEREHEKDGKTTSKTHISIEVDLYDMTPGAETEDKPKATAKADEDAIDKGLDEATENDDEEGN